MNGNDWVLVLVVLTYVVVMTTMVFWLLPQHQKRRSVPMWDSNQTGGRTKVIAGKTYPVKAGFSLAQIRKEGMPQCNHWGTSYIHVLDHAADGSWQTISCRGCGRVTVALSDGITEAVVPHPVTGQMCVVELFPHPDKFREEGLHAPNCLVC